MATAFQVFQEQKLAETITLMYKSIQEVPLTLPAQAEYDALPEMTKVSYPTLASYQQGMKTARIQMVTSVRDKLLQTKTTLANGDNIGLLSSLPTIGYTAGVQTQYQTDCQTIVNSATSKLTALNAL
jgi:hypothetical protein